MSCFTLHFPSISLLFTSTAAARPVLNIGSQKLDVVDLDLWHRRLGDKSHRAIREAVRNRLIEGVVVLDGKIHIGRAIGAPVTYVRMQKCISPPGCLKSPGGLVPCARLSADVHIMQNIPSREDYHLFFVVNHANTLYWVLPLNLTT